MLRKEKDNILWLEFEILQPFPEICHAVFLRKGGESQGPYESLNFGGGSGDDPKLIARNRDKARHHLKCATLVDVHQVHSDSIHYLLSEDTQGIRADGMLTQQEEIGLLIKHADCQAAVFYDPYQKAIGCAHSGWRGSVKNIYGKMVRQMKEYFGTNPADLRVGISPSLGPCCAQFINYKEELPESFLSFQVKPFFFDFWEISQHQLLQAGILSSHLEIAKICSFCHEKDCYSYRRDKVTGRNGTVIYKKC